MARYTTSGTVNTVQQINAELEKIQTAQKEFLARDGETPNEMKADLDMNSNRIINLPKPLNPTSPVRLQDAKGLIGSLAIDGRAVYQNELIIRDAMHTWWGSNFINNGRYSYYAPTQSDGAVKLVVVDNISNKVNSYVVSRDFNPDDHNSGAVYASDGKVLAVWGGRSRNDGGNIFNWQYLYFDEGTDPSQVEVQEIEMGRNYPNIFSVDDEVLLISQRILTENVPQWSFRICDWPDLQFGELTTLFQSTKDWPYFALRRDIANRNRINFAFGWHPIEQVSAEVRYGYIERSPQDGQWRIFSVAGIEIANMSTGANLPLDENDIPVAYEPAVDEKVRLLGVHTESFVICSFTSIEDANAGLDGTYKHVRLVDGEWEITDICESGAPFQKSDSFYFGGALIDETNLNDVHVIVNEAELYFYEKYSFNGLTWDLVDRIDPSRNSGAQVVMGRPLAEALSDEQVRLGALPDLRVIMHAGRYNPTRFVDFNTSVFDVQALGTEWSASSHEISGTTIASSSSKARDHQSAAIACTGVDVKNRASAAIGSSSTTLDGTGFLQVVASSRDVNVTDDPSAVFVGGSDTITMSANRSAVLGSWRCSIQFGSSERGYAKVILGGLDSEVQMNASAVIGSSDCSIQRNLTASEGGFNTVIAGSNNCSSTGVQGFIGASSSSTTNSKNSGVLASTASRAGSGSLTTNTPSAVVACNNVQADDYRAIGLGSSAVGLNASGAFSLGSTSGDVVGTDSGLIASGNSDITGGAYSSIIGSESSSNGGFTRAVLLGSDNATLRKNSCVAGGVTGLKWELDSATGDINLAGTTNTGVVFADIAKMIENGVQGEVLPVGSLLRVLGDKVYLAKEDEPIDAIVASTPSMINGDTQFEWQGRYLRDDFGRLTGEENPEYNPELVNTPRSQRPAEWTISGVQGLIRTRVDSSVSQSLVDTRVANRADVYITPSSVDGVGKLSHYETNAKVMRVEKEFNKELGYGVALVYFKG